MLKRVLEPEGHPVLETATTLGVINSVLAVIGLTRWVFVVAGLAQLYTDPNSSKAVRAAAEVTFQAIHQYGGVVIGEHSGFSLIFIRTNPPNPCSIFCVAARE